MKKTKKNKQKGPKTSCNEFFVKHSIKISVIGVALIWFLVVGLWVEDGKSNIEDNLGGVSGVGLDNRTSEISLLSLIEQEVGFQIVCINSTIEELVYEDGDYVRDACIHHACEDECKKKVEICVNDYVNEGEYQKIGACDNDVWWCQRECMKYYESNPTEHETCYVKPYVLKHNKTTCVQSMIVINHNISLTEG